LQRDAHIFQHGQVRENRRNLERAPDPEAGDVRWLERGDIAAIEYDASTCRREEFGEEIEARGLAGAIRADQGVNAAAGDAQIDRPHRDESGELLGQLFRFEDRVFGHKFPQAASGAASV
jgi:hypothetical protein